MYSLSQHIDLNKIFLVQFSELQGRIDPFYYNHEFNKYEKILARKPFKKFRYLIKSINNGFDFRDYKEIGTPYLKVANIKQGELDFTKIQYVDFNSSEISKNIQLKKGNLLLTRKGTFGNTFAIDKDYDFVISSEVFYIELKDNSIHPKFLEIFFNSKIGQTQFDKNKIGAIMGSLSQEAIRELMIPIPLLDIQEKIINIYQTAYHRKQQYETQAQALLTSIDDYLLGELGINMPTENDVDGIVSYQGFELNKQNSLVKKGRLFLTEFGEVADERLDPEYYSTSNKNNKTAIKQAKFPLKKISSNCVFQTGYAFKSEDYINESDCRLITIKNISKNTVLLNDCTYLPNDYFILFEKFQIRKNDLLIAMTGATIGKVGVYEDDKKALLNQRNGIIRSDTINTFWLMNLLNTELYQSLIIRNAVGGAQPNISETSITKLHIPFPPIEKQNEIASYISKIRQQAQSLQKESIQILQQAKEQIDKMILE